MLPIIEENPMIVPNKLPSVKENGINNEELNITKLSGKLLYFKPHYEVRKFD